MEWLFAGFLLTFMFVGFLASLKATATTEDYLVASRNVGAWLTGLSAAASQVSGVILIGFIGVTYLMGASAAWMAIGYGFGNYLAWRFVVPRIKVRSASANTIPAFIADSRQDRRLTHITSALIALVVLVSYAATQLLAGSKALSVIFGWPAWYGTALGTGIVLAYCLFGGIRASIWTDAIQALVAISAVVLLGVVALIETGGITTLFTRLSHIDPALTDLNPHGRFGFAMFLVGWIVGGLGCLGQPHIMVRAISANSKRDVSTARTIFSVWLFSFLFFTLLVALCCRILIPIDSVFDAELAFPELSLQLLPPVFVGFMLAGLFSSTMSTADSQVLVCSSAITQDIFVRWKKSYLGVKFSTVFITITAFGIAMWTVVYNNTNVFDLTIIAWSALASSLGPLMLLRCFDMPFGDRVAVPMMISGLLTVVLWRFYFDLSHDVMEALPGICVPFLVYGSYRLWLRFKVPA